jgi:hypothetical protein
MQYLGYFLAAQSAGGLQQQRMGVSLGHALEGSPDSVVHGHALLKIACRRTELVVLEWHKHAKLATSMVAPRFVERDGV